MFACVCVGACVYVRSKLIVIVHVLVRVRACVCVSVRVTAGENPIQ